MEQVGEKLCFKKLALCQYQVIHRKWKPQKQLSLHQLTSVTYNTAIGNIHGDFTNVEIAFVTECISKC